MRIRSKLLCFLLVVVLVPLCALGWYSWRQTGKLGRELAENAAQSMEGTAANELAQTAEMLGETCANTLDMLQTSLSLIGVEASRALGRPVPVPERPILFDTDFDAGAVPAKDMSTPPGTDVPCSYDHLVFHLPPGVTREETRRETAALSTLLPVFRTLFSRHRQLMLFGYVGLASGLHCAYPGHGGYPPDFDPRRRPWYANAIEAGDMVWSIMVDAVTKQVTATMSIPVAQPDGPVFGVAGLDIPMGELFLRSDLSRTWTERMRALVLSVDHAAPAGKSPLLVVAARDYARESRDWTAPVELDRLTSSDGAALAAVEADLESGRGGVRRLPVDGQESLLAYAPVTGRKLAVALVVPRDVAIAGAIRAEDRVLTAVNRLLGQNAWFVAGAVVVVILLVFPTARVVTRPVRELAAAADRLAAGDFSARTRIGGRDELADLARTFNDMAPQLLERIKLKNDMTLAMEVQQHLLPHRPPAIDGLDMAAMSLYCDETGGDYFDFLEFAQDDAVHADIVVGDVTGHGVSAALFMATGRALLRGRAVDQSGPAALLTEVNTLLCQDTHLTGRFITLFFLRLDRAAREIVWSRAGHDPGLLFDPATGEFESLMGAGIPLGATPEWTYEESRRPWLTPGQVLVLYTDGIHEARNATDTMYGRERIMEVVRDNAEVPASAVINALVADLRDFKGGLPLEDDVTLVVIKATA
jgi:sigma-B regulation protein RsbU (phosphoserine phosphatase)